MVARLLKCPTFSVITLAIGMVLMQVGSLLGDDAIAPDVATARAGEKATVKFRVESSKLLEGDRPVCFLNSKKNHRDEDNFTVVIFSEALTKFQNAGTKNPAEHFYHRTIQVTGEIGLRQGKPQILVEYPGQIEIVSEEQE